MSNSALMQPVSPDDVSEEYRQEATEKFTLLIAAAQADKRLAMIPVKSPVEGGQVHFVLAVMNENGSEAIGVAVVPVGMNIGAYIRYFDSMAAQMPGAELDPDYKGVKM